MSRFKLAGGWSFLNILLGIILLATLVFVVLSCVLTSMVWPWLALAFGAATFVIALIRYYRL